MSRPEEENADPPSSPAPGGDGGLGISWPALLLNAVGWSAGSLVVQWDLVQETGVPLYQALPFVLAGGMTMMLAAWLGLTAVFWAMGRLLGGSAGLGRVAGGVSRAGWWFVPGAPAAALIGLPGAGPVVVWGLVGITVLSAGRAALALQGEARRLQGFSGAKAWANLGLLAVFLGSLFSLYLG